MTEYVFAPPPKQEVDTAALPKNHYRPSWTTYNKIEAYRAEIAAMREKFGEHMAVQLIREICRKDLFYLCYEVLDYKDLEEPLHNDMCDFMAYAETTRKNSLILIPRAHFKSTIATVGRCIQWIIQDQDTAIGLFSGDMKNARKFATEIRSHLENNSTLKTLFPDVLFDNPRKESSLWTTDEFTVKRTAKGMKKKEGTVKIFGLLQNIPTGDHFNHLIGDDIVDQKIVQSEEQMEKIKDQIQYLTPLQMTPIDPIHFVGTRYHVRDAYAKMLEDDTYDVYLRRDIENGAPIMPGRFTLEMLDATRIKIGNYKYQCQYKLDPQDPADKKFKMEWLNYFKPWLPGSEAYAELNYYLIVDPANKQKKESDFTAMVVLAVDHDMNIFFLDGLHDKMNPKQRIDAVFELAKRWNINTTIYETIAFQDTDRFWIERKMVEIGYYFSIIEVSHRKANKFDFIMSTQPIFEQGRFYLPNQPIWYQRKWENPDDGMARKIDIRQIFEQQYDLFPNLEHDDMLDDVAMGLRQITVGTKLEEKKEPTDFPGAYKKKEEDDDFNLMAN